MKKLSRRALLAAGAGGAALGAIPFSTWIQQQAWGAAPRVRYNAYSPQGKAMLKIYDKGVKKMMTTPESNPLSWIFQWYTHDVKDPPGVSKASELSRIYPGGNPPAFYALAKQMWDTCQAHNGPNEDFFLPWHRMFVYYFELIVRQASNEPSFTLPYWNYSNPAEAALPPEFLVTSSPLYRSSRNPGPNGGTKIPANLVALDALKETVYSANGADQGFCANLDFGLHGAVHVWVGNNQGMASIPWAGNDPIFWMHHCNIDRLWASWNRGKCKNPTYAAWLNQQYVFADIHGKQVVATVKDVNDTAMLDYTYDAFEAASCAPIIVRINPLILATLATESLIARTPLRVNLAPPPPKPQEKALMLSDQVKALGTEKNVYLVLQDAHAAAPSGVVYDVYLDLPEGAAASESSANYVGTINFFGVTMKSGNMAAMTPRTFSLNVTDKIKALQAKGALSATPAVTLVPQGEPNEAAKPTIGQIQLVSQ